MKILFIIPEYSHGGTNKSLENLLSLIDKSKFDISIYCLYEDGGEYYKKVFSPYVLKKSRLYYWMHDNVLTRKMMGLFNKLTKRDNFAWLYKREARILEVQHCPQVVVGFQEGTATLFASFFENTNNRIAWYHCPYTSFNSNSKSKFETTYKCFDHIVCVSNTFKIEMTKLFPSFSEKFVTIYNTLNTTKIRNASYEQVDDRAFDNSNFTLLSVGRFAKKSQFHLIPEIVHNIMEIAPGISFKWFIIASGNECEEITNSDIQKFHLQEKLVLLGAKDNPYKYMRNADIVVCTSDSESFSYVIAEAKILHTPVLSNDFPVANEVVDEQTGWIANINDMPQLLARIINDDDGEYNKKKSSIMDYEYSNEEILQKIDSLFLGEG